MTFETDLIDFFCIAYSAEGNYALFEYADEPNFVWQEVSVWTLRSFSDAAWKEIHVAYESEEYKTIRFRVTKYPMLREASVDTTYHPSVESWRIDPNKVKEFLNVE